MPINNKASLESDKPKFSELLAQPEVKARWEKVRKYFFLRESTYDMSNRCNIRCDGCYYFEGEKQFAKEIGDDEPDHAGVQEQINLNLNAFCRSASDGGLKVD